MNYGKELNISTNEINELAKKVNFMIQVSAEKHLKETYVTRIYEEWMLVAQRLNKGNRMIIQTVDAIPDKSALSSHAQYNNLVNLYTFLLQVLGFYDMFFKRMLNRDHYDYLQGTILDILRREE